MSDDIGTMIREFGLSRVSGPLCRLVRQSIRLRAARCCAEELELGESRIGGLPDLPEGWAWPKWNGEDLGFIAQIGLAEVARLGIAGCLPPSGILYFFYDPEQRAWGFDPADRGAWRVLFYDGAADMLRRQAEPPSLDEESICEPCKLKMSVESTLPPTESAFLSGLALTEAEGSRYYDLLAELEESRGPVLNRFLGHPDQIQYDMAWESQMASNGVFVGDLSYMGDPRTAELEKGASNWRLLLQIDSDPEPNMMWEDDGRIYYWIHERALEQRDFGKAWFVLQCY